MGAAAAQGLQNLSKSVQVLCPAPPLQNRWRQWHSCATAYVALALRVFHELVHADVQVPLSAVCVRPSSEVDSGRNACLRCIVTLVLLPDIEDSCLSIRSQRNRLARRRASGPGAAAHEVILRSLCAPDPAETVVFLSRCHCFDVATSCASSLLMRRRLEDLKHSFDLQ